METKSTKGKTVPKKKKRQMVIYRKDDVSVDSEASTLLYPSTEERYTFMETTNESGLLADNETDNNSNASSSDSEGEDMPLREDLPVKTDRWDKKEVEALMDAINLNREALKFHFSGTMSGRDIRRQAWRDVALYVNMEAQTHRTVKQIVGKTSDFTQKQKQKYNTLRRALNKTGSAPPPKKMKMSRTQSKALDFLKEEAVRGIPGIEPMDLNPSQKKSKPTVKGEEIWKAGRSDFSEAKLKMKITKIPKKEKDKETRREERKKKQERKIAHEKKMKEERKKEGLDKKWRDKVKEDSRKKEAERRLNVERNSEETIKEKGKTVVKCTKAEYLAICAAKAKRKEERARIRAERRAKNQ